jgi:UDP-N-acetylmuramoyl-L-alanyl-D-glutamate--2,6-diaminopimelate ligase
VTPIQPTSSVALEDLIDALPPGTIIHGNAADVVVDDVTHDSRSGGPGVLFAARPGQRSDGHDHAPDAVAAGCPALLVERVLDLRVPQIVVGSVAAAMGSVAAAVHGHPSAELTLVGITGTNGKTTSTYLVDAALRAAGRTTGLIGTVQTLIAGEPVGGVRTTPESTDLQRLLRRMRAGGVDAATMEVSSHGLALGRILGTRFDVAAFTNLTQDHLDFHRDLDDYFAAKAALFTPGYTDRAVVNIDDPYGRILVERGGVPMTTVGIGRRAGIDADVTATDVVTGPRGSTFQAVLGNRRLAVRTQLAGHFNVANCVLSLAVADTLGIDLEAAAAGMAALAGVPGRMERVEAGQPFTVLVDYAHTPDSIENVLRASRALTDGRVIVVLGCGGDRDVAKRPLMGRAAAELADLAVLTSDNPRSEDPEAILAAVAAGARDVAGASWTVEVDRRTAIAQALRAAAPHDVVVIAGKGHETYQELADRTIDFDDRAVARELLASGEVGA